MWLPIRQNGLVVGLLCYWFQVCYSLTPLRLHLDRPLSSLIQMCLKVLGWFHLFVLRKPRRMFCIPGIPEFKARNSVIITEIGAEGKEEVLGNRETEKERESPVFSAEPCLQLAHQLNAAQVIPTANPSPDYRWVKASKMVVVLGQQLLGSFYTANRQLKYQ